MKMNDLGHLSDGQPWVEVLIVIGGFLLLPLIIILCLKRLICIDGRVYLKSMNVDEGNGELDLNCVNDEGTRKSRKLLLDCPLCPCLNYKGSSSTITNNSMSWGIPSDDTEVDVAIKDMVCRVPLSLITPNVTAWKWEKEYRKRMRLAKEKPKYSTSLPNLRNLYVKTKEKRFLIPQRFPFTMGFTKAADKETQTIISAPCSCDYCKKVVPSHAVSLGSFRGISDSYFEKEVRNEMFAWSDPDLKYHQHRSESVFMRFEDETTKPSKLRKDRKYGIEEDISVIGTISQEGIYPENEKYRRELPDRHFDGEHKYQKLERELTPANSEESILRDQISQITYADVHPEPKPKTELPPLSYSGMPHIEDQVSQIPKEVVDKNQKQEIQTYLPDRISPTTIINIPKKGEKRELTHPINEEVPVTTLNQAPKTYAEVHEPLHSKEKQLIYMATKDVVPNPFMISKSEEVMKPRKKKLRRANSSPSLPFTPKPVPVRKNLEMRHLNHPDIYCIGEMSTALYANPSTSSFIQDTVKNNNKALSTCALSFEKLFKSESSSSEEEIFEY